MKPVESCYSWDQDQIHLNLFKQAFNRHQYHHAVAHHPNRRDLLRWKKESYKSYLLLTPSWKHTRRRKVPSYSAPCQSPLGLTSQIHHPCAAKILLNLMMTLLMIMIDVYDTAQQYGCDDSAESIMMEKNCLFHEPPHLVICSNLGILKIY